MVKLKDEARNAVAGKMMSPKDINIVIKTFEMRYGRSDQIIEMLISTIVKGNNLQNPQLMK